jgi:hypothetical protein
MPLQHGGRYSGLPRSIASCYSPNCLEEVFSEVGQEFIGN